MRRSNLSFLILPMLVLCLSGMARADFADAIDDAAHDIQKSFNDAGKSKTRKFIESPAGMASIGAAILVAGICIGVAVKKGKK